MILKSAARRTLTATLLAGSLAAVTGASSASASTSDPFLYAGAQSDYRASCSYAANVRWERATDHLDGSVTVDNHLWFAACRKQLVITLVDDEGAQHSVEIPIDTACATTDPTCPSLIVKPIDQYAGVSRHLRPWVDHITADVVDR